MVPLARSSVKRLCPQSLVKPDTTPWSRGRRLFHRHHRDEQLAKNASHKLHPPHDKSRQREAERDFFLSVLGASTTRRDAQAYLSRFKPSKQATPRHLALVMIRSLDILQDHIVNGLCQTFSQMTRLGLHCIIALDSNSSSSVDHIVTSSANKDLGSAQADRLVRGLESFPSIKASRLEDLIELTGIKNEVKSSVQIRGSAEVQHPQLLNRLLQRGVVPVIPSSAFVQRESGSSFDMIPGDEVVLALTRYFAGFAAHTQVANSDHRPSTVSETRDADETSTVLERIIILDPAGPLPSTRHSSRGHVFVNLEQEYHDIYEDIRDYHVKSDLPAAGSPRTESNVKQSTKPSEHFPGQQPVSSCQIHGSNTSQTHLKNLELLRNTLSLLPSSSSAFLTTPEAAATLPRITDNDSNPGVGTRRPKNPLIFNLLTNRPLNSSSLPITRLSHQPSTHSTQPSYPTNTATFAKRGMPLTMIPDPRIHIWKPPLPHEKHLTLQDPDIDFPRLLNLIEDSFDRPLDVKDYMNRIKNRIAGIIVAGSYEGGAVLTWELPPGVPDDGSPATRARLVPYLDKFAVLKRSQGAGGVADIVFSAMVRSCFPEGVCWRSRQDNPVNKWYFERAVGSWKIPGNMWTMFWTGGDVAVDGKRFLDYEAVCRSVRPSWADNKGLVD